MAATAAASSIASVYCLQFLHFKEFKGLQCISPSITQKHSSSLGVCNLRKVPCINVKKCGRFNYVCATMLDYPSDSSVSAQSSASGQDNSSTNGVLQVDAVALGTFAADMSAGSDEFFVEDSERDLDNPTEGFSSIPEAIEDIRQGKFVIVVDDEDRENEGDLIMAASLVTPDAMAFIVRHGTGIVCVSMKGEDLDRLQLPLMVTHKENEEKLRTAFTVSVDVKEGTTTGVSAKDRAKTILALASPDSKNEDFCRPGHIFPLRYREGGVLKRAGHTEASVDLAILAGLRPAAVLCEIVDDDDGSMARLPKLREFAKKENLKVISIADLIRYYRI